MGNHILLIGDLKKSRILGETFLQQGYQVTVINPDREECERLAEEERVHVVWGDGSKAKILEAAMVDTIDTVIAMRQKEEDNFVICKMCKEKYGVKQTIAVIDDIGKKEFFCQRGIDKVICSFDWMNALFD
ncbi:MAG: NAD-binding protein [Lachnospiraceae bacterium]|nr:NAD-binding protein [Lachnospiraceae bacterium]